MQHNITDASQYKQSNTHSKTCMLTSYIYYILSVFSLRSYFKAYNHELLLHFSAVCTFINQKIKIKNAALINITINWTCILCEISTLDLILQMCCSVRNTQSPGGLLCLKPMTFFTIYTATSRTQFRLKFRLPQVRNCYLKRGTSHTM